MIEQPNLELTDEIIKLLNTTILTLSYRFITSHLKQLYAKLTFKYIFIQKFIR
jgi:hypothetical protein